MNTWEQLAELPVEIAEYSLQALQADVSSEFTRKSTVIHLRGAGEEGVGEDVTYDAVDHEILQAAGPILPLAGRFTLASFSEHLTGLPLFPEAPQREVSARYRMWAYESAALDLALSPAHIAALEALSEPALGFPANFLKMAGMFAHNGATVNGETSIAWPMSPANDAERY